MDALREDLTRYAESGVLGAPALRAALRLAGVTPDAAAWRQFFDRLLVVAGALLVAVGVIFFVAFNWQALGRFAKLGMLEALVVLPTVYALLPGVQLLRAKAALLFAVLVLGGLLALVGQTYQTGADNYELFVAWALLALPWVLAAQWPPLWAVWWTLVNLALALYLFQVLDPLRILLSERMRPSAIALLNLAGLAAAEFAYQRVAALRTPWLARYCALLLLGSAGFSALVFVLGDAGLTRGYAPGFLLYCACIAGGAWYYQKVRRDLFPLAAGIVSLIVVLTGWMGRYMVIDGGSGAFFGLMLLAALVIGATVGATWWLRELNRKWHMEPAA